MKRSLALLAALLAAAVGAARAQTPASSGTVGAFDGDLSRTPAAARPAWGPLARLAGPDGALDLCDAALLANAALPRRQFALDERLTCRGDPAGPAAPFLAMTTPGASGGAFAGAGLRARLSAAAHADAALGDSVRRYYARVRVAPAAPHPGWAWALALEEAGGDPARAMRLAAFCGHDDAEPAELRSPLPAAEVRLALESERERLKRRLAGRAGAAPSDPLAWSTEDLAANDAAARRARLDALGLEDFAESHENVCPAPASAFYRTDGLGAGAPAGATHRRVYAGAALACELSREGASRVLAENAPPNAAWVDRLLRLAAEARTRARGPAPDGGPLGELNPARVDAFALLARWDPEKNFPGPGAPARPSGWSRARYAAASAALRALGDEWRAAVEEHGVGARFGARVCARP